MGARDQWEFPPFFRPQWQSPRTALTAVQGDCERVMTIKTSLPTPTPTLLALTSPPSPHPATQPPPSHPPNPTQPVYAIVFTPFVLRISELYDNWKINVSPKKNLKYCSL